MSKITTIVDHVGRTVIGEFVKEDDNTLTLNNPVILFVQPNQQTGQLNLQYIPYIFMEFLTQDSKTTSKWTFQKSNIVTSELTLDEKIVAQYKVVNSPPPAVQETAPEVIKLFED